MQDLPKLFSRKSQDSADMFTFFNIEDLFWRMKMYAKYNKSAYN